MSGRKVYAVLEANNIDYNIYCHVYADKAAAIEALKKCYRACLEDRKGDYDEDMASLSDDSWQVTCHNDDIFYGSITETVVDE